MKQFFTDPALRRLLVLRGAEAAVLSGLIVACVLGYRLTRQARLVALQEENELGAKPNYILALSQLQGEMRDRAHDIDRILALVEHPDTIVHFIESIESTATRYGVEVSVSRIDEVEERNEGGEVIAPTGPFRSINLTLTAAGSGDDLLEYLHNLEQGQRLLVIREWDVSYDETAAVAESQLETAREIGEAPPRAAATPSAKLEAELILLVHNETYAL